MPNLLSRRLFILVFGLGTAGIMAQAEPYIADAPASGVELGLGWNGLAAELVPNRCVRFAPVQEGGQEATLSISEISDSAELRSHLGVTASASVKGIVSEGSASAEFVENSTASTTSNTIAVRAAIVNGAMFAGPHRSPALRRFAFTRTLPIDFPLFPPEPEEPSFANDAVSLEDWVVKEFMEGDPADRSTWTFKDGGKDAFHKLCGTGFVSGVYSGVEMFSVITFSSTDRSTVQAAKAQISAGFGGVVGSAGVEDSGSSTLKKANTKMSFLQRGGAGGNIPSDRAQLINKLASIAAEARDAPEFFDIRITPYEDLPNYPEKGTERPGEQKELIARRYLQLKTFYRDLQAVIDNLNQQDAPKPKAGTDNLALLQVAAASATDVVNYERCFSVRRFEDFQDNVSQLIQWIEQAQRQVAENGWDYSHFKFSDDEKAKVLEELNNLGIGSLPDTDEQQKLPEFLHWLAHAFTSADLRILLPPQVQTGTGEAALCPDGQKQLSPNQRALYRHYVMRDYVRPANRRVCASLISDVDCLDNAQLRDLKEAMPVPSQPSQPVDGLSAYICSAIKNVTQCIGAPSAAQIEMVTDRQSAHLLTFEELPDQKGTFVLSYKAQGAAAQYLKVDLTKKMKDVSSGRLMVATSNKDEASTFRILNRPEESHMMLPSKRINFADTKLGGKTMCLFSRTGANQTGLYTNGNDCVVSADTSANYTANAYSWLFYEKDNFN